MKKSKAKIIADAVCGIIMLLSILVYLILGITINFWHPGWTIIVGATFVSGIISIITNTKEDLDDLSNNNNEENK